MYHEPAPGLYRHYKRGKYLVIGTARKYGKYWDTIPISKAANRPSLLFLLTTSHQKLC